jgi:AcrR family transcriptional regulator
MPQPSEDPVVADILAVATAEFAQYGLGGARLERIVAGTRTSKRMVYYHFSSKEGLYKAVLEHVFYTTRFRDDSFDPTSGSPMEALTLFALNTFESLSERPDFVRLITMENLSGATYVKTSSIISKLNRRGMQHLETVLARGQKEGTMRTDISALDVYMNVVGMCFYHVANRAGYMAGGFDDSDNAKIASATFHHARKQAVIDATLRYAQPSLMPASPV